MKEPIHMEKRWKSRAPPVVNFIDVVTFKKLLPRYRQTHTSLLPPLTSHILRSGTP